MMQVRGQASQRGSALLIVLFLSLFCGLLAASSITSARDEAQRARVQLARLEARAAMDGAATYAAFEMARSRRNETVLPFDVVLNGLEVRVQMAPSMEHVDLNLAGQQQLQGMFRRAGLDDDEAAKRAAQILDWRDPDSLRRAPLRASEGVEMLARNGNFISPREALLIPGVTERFYEDIASMITVFGGVDPRASGGVLLPGMRVTLQAVASPRDRDQALAPEQYVFRGTGNVSDPIVTVGLGANH